MQASIASAYSVLQSLRERRKVLRRISTSVRSYKSHGKTEKRRKRKMIHFAEPEDEETLCGVRTDQIEDLYRIEVTNSPELVTCNECLKYLDR